MDIEEILNTRIKVVWILKEEDKKLTELGFKNNRNDPRSAYLSAGIEMA